MWALSGLKDGHTCPKVFRGARLSPIPPRAGMRHRLIGRYMRFLTNSAKKGHNLVKHSQKATTMQVSIQEFKSHLSQYVNQARSGQLIELTSHRKVVARLAGVPSGEVVGVSRLLATGAATWQGGKPAGAALKLQPKGTTVSKMVLEDRG